MTSYISPSSRPALTAVQSTSLLTAYWRDQETRFPRPNDDDQDDDDNGVSTRSSNAMPPLIQDPPAHALLDALLPDSWRRDYETSPIRNVGREILAVRTRAFDDWLTAQQPPELQSRRRVAVVNLGAGMCCRPYRLEALKSNSNSSNMCILWCDVDSDLSLLHTKRSVLTQAGFVPHVPILDVAGDLSGAASFSSLLDQLVAHVQQSLQEKNLGMQSMPSDNLLCNETDIHQRPSQFPIPVDFIAEGLLAYLKDPEHLFELAAARSVSGSRMSLTAVEPALKESFLSQGVSLPYGNLMPIQHVMEMATRHGWTVQEHIRPTDWAFRYPGRGRKIPPGFHVLFLALP